MNVIGYHVNKEGIYASDGRVCKEPPFGPFLLEGWEHHCIRIFSNIDADVAALLYLFKLTQREAERLYSDGKLTFVGTPYRIRYFPDKTFTISYGYGENNPFALFCDASQYEPSLLDVQCDNPLARAKQAQEAGERVRDALVELGLHPTSLVSPSNVYSKEILEQIDLPTFMDMPDEASEIAYGCCKGNWVEAFQLGHWDKAYDYDLSSGYPYFAMGLPDFRLGKWVHSREYQQQADYGYCRCEVMIDASFSPIIFKANNEQNFTPKGIFRTDLTKKEIDFIHKRNLGYATIINGWWWYKDPAAVIIRPMETPIAELFRQKQLSTGLKRECAKRIMNGTFYGLFIQKKRDDELGDFFMAPLAAEIESQCRLKIAETCLDNNVLPIHVAVDGFACDRLLPINDTNNIGGWRLSYQGKMFSCGSHLKAIEGKIGTGDFSVSYDWLREQIESNPDAEEYRMEKMSIITLNRAIAEHKLEKIGSIEKTYRSVMIGDTKRRYYPVPSTGGELLNDRFQSKPYNAKTILLLNPEEGEEDAEEQETTL